MVFVDGPPRFPVSKNSSSRPFVLRPAAWRRRFLFFKRRPRLRNRCRRSIERSSHSFETMVDSDLSPVSDFNRYGLRSFRSSEETASQVGPAQIFQFV